MRHLPFYKRLLFLSLIILSFTGSVSSQIIKNVFLSKGDSTKNRYILVTPPDSVKIKGFMFLIPGAFEYPKDVLIQSDLPYYAARKGILTFIPIFETGITSFGIDDSTQNSVKEMVDYCVKTYNLKNSAFYIGGFSIGGTTAIKYAELAIQKNYPVKPKAVFAIDPPLDFERFYNSAERNLRLMKGIYVNPENVYMTNKIREKMGGNPETALKNYYMLSPYSFNDTSQSAVKLLRNIPVSIYAEPDIEWWLKNRAFDYSDINAIDGAAMINELHLLGNFDSRFIATTNKGYRMPNKVKHPHSWSILDPNDLFSWIKSLDKRKN